MASFYRNGNDLRLHKSFYTGSANLGTLSPEGPYPGTTKVLGVCWFPVGKLLDSQILSPEARNPTFARFGLGALGV